MNIKYTPLLLISLIFVSCSTDTDNGNTEQTIEPREFNELPNITEKDLRYNENIIDYAYEVHGTGYLFSDSEFITVFKNIKNKSDTSDASGIENADTDFKNVDLERLIATTQPKAVSILGIKSVKDGSFKNVINSNTILIQVEQDKEKIYGYVDSSTVYLDDKKIFLYAIDDDIDNRIRLDSDSYSVGHAIALNKVYGPSDITERAYSSVSSSRTEKHCDLFDAAMLLRAIGGEVRGEFETKEEFATRIATLKLLPNSTAWNEKIYFNWKHVSSSSFKYDIDKSEMKIVAVAPPSSRYSSDGIINGFWEDAYSYSNNSGKLSELVNYMIRGNPTGDQCGKITKANWDVKQLPSGNFDIDYKVDDYREDEIEGIGLSKTIKMDRDEARTIKENKELSWFFMWGLKPSTASGNRYTKSTVIGTYPNEYTRTTDHGNFYFDATIEYLMLVDSEGRLRASWFSNDYKENFIDNDLMIQSHAYRNKDISQDFIDNNSREARLAKYFSNAVKEIPFIPSHKDSD